ncbi:MAG: glycosyltransferase [Gemmatimonadetes bacterium]|nr:glycosyltransferase [Gemmatimonadota bacterium]
MRFSVIIPTYHRAVQLDRCLAAIDRLRFPSDDMEVIVVDDASAEVTRAQVSGSVRCRLRYVPARRRTGPAGARNAGAAEAAGQFLAFLDDDCIPDAAWLDAMHHAIERRPHETVLWGGRNTMFGSGPFVHASQVLLDYLLDQANRDPERATFFPSNNLVVAREAFLDIGGFDGGFPRAAAEDRDFCERWLARGFRMVQVPDAVVAHEHRAGWDDFVRQHLGYGRGLAILNARRAQRDSTVPRLQAPGYYLGLMAAGWRAGGPVQRRLAATALLGVTQVATLVGYLDQRRRINEP